MSTGVNEYPLLQSPGNPHNKMHNSLIKSATVPGGRPLAFSSQPHRDFSRFDAQSCQSFISLYTFFFFKNSAKSGCSYYLGFAGGGGGGNNGSACLLLKATPPQSTSAALCFIFVFLFFFNQRSIVSLALFFFHTPLCFSSPPRCEQVIG